MNLSNPGEENMDTMLDKAKAIQAQLSTWRRDFHMHPELGFHETRTSARVADILEQLGYRLKRGIGRTGVVADLGSGKPVVAIRADMDALPLQESNLVSYTSQNPGVMHACGHDSHMAMGLGAAALLSREKFPGSIRFLFQPSEEVGDEEGLSGAPRMIQEGAMEAVDMVIATHVEPTAPAGTIRIESGPASAGVDSWFGEIIGKGAHGAHPHESIDPFYISAYVILALNGIISRRLDPFDPAVVSIGSLHGGFTENVIPEQVKMTGTLRYLEKSVQKQIHTEIRRAFEIARAFGGDFDLKFEIGTSPMMNDPVISSLIATVAADLLGGQNVLPLINGMGAEDFGCFMELAPGAMFSLGTGNAELKRLLHNPDFDLDESCLPVGVAVLAETALRYLRKKG
jgi:amidohydrolase